jgi:hypothetical protein
METGSVNRLAPFEPNAMLGIGVLERRNGSVRTQREACSGNDLQGMMRTIPGSEKE